jgi:hypothetical protein
MTARDVCQGFLFARSTIHSMLYNIQSRIHCKLWFKCLQTIIREGLFVQETVVPVYHHVCYGVLALFLSLCEKKGKKSHFKGAKMDHQLITVGINLKHSAPNYRYHVDHHSR